MLDRLRRIKSRFGVVAMIVAGLFFTVWGGLQAVGALDTARSLANTEQQHWLIATVYAVRAAIRLPTVVAWTFLVSGVLLSLYAVYLLSRRPPMAKASGHGPGKTPKGPSPSSDQEFLDSTGTRNPDFTGKPRPSISEVSPPNRAALAFDPLDANSFALEWQISDTGLFLAVTSRLRPTLEDFSVSVLDLDWWNHGATPPGYVEVAEMEILRQYNGALLHDDAGPKAFSGQLHKIHVLRRPTREILRLSGRRRGDNAEIDINLPSRLRGRWRATFLFSWKGTNRYRSMEFFWKSDERVLPISESVREAGGLVIVSAMYGLPLFDRDVTAAVRDLVVNGEIDDFVSNETMGCDPIIGQRKRLLVTYKGPDGKQKFKEFSEKDRLQIP